MPRKGHRVSLAFVDAEFCITLKTVLIRVFVTSRPETPSRTHTISIVSMKVCNEHLENGRCLERIQRIHIIHQTLAIGTTQDDGKPRIDIAVIFAC
jgi:hypothetical protein